MQWPEWGTTTVRHQAYNRACAIFHENPQKGSSTIAGESQRRALVHEKHGPHGGARCSDLTNLNECILWKVNFSVSRTESRNACQSNIVQWTGCQHAVLADFTYRGISQVHYSHCTRRHSVDKYEFWRVRWSFWVMSSQSPASALTQGREKRRSPDILASWRVLSGWSTS